MKKMIRALICSATCAAMLWAIALQAAPQTQISATWPGVRKFEDPEMGDMTLEFLPEGKYRMRRGWEGGGWTVNGTYQIQVNALALKLDHVEQSPSATQGMAPMKDAICMVVEDLADLKFSEFLQCRSVSGAVGPFRYPITETAVHPGAERTIDGIRAIMLDAKDVKVTTAVSLRKTPSADAESSL